MPPARNSLPLTIALALAAGGCSSQSKSSTHGSSGSGTSAQSNPGSPINAATISKAKADLTAFNDCQNKVIVPALQAFGFDLGEFGSASTSGPAVSTSTAGSTSTGSGLACSIVQTAQGIYMPSAFTGVPSFLAMVAALQPGQEDFVGAYKVEETDAGGFDYAVNITGESGNAGESDVLQVSATGTKVHIVFTQNPSTLNEGSVVSNDSGKVDFTCDETAGQATGSGASTNQTTLSSQSETTSTASSVDMPTETQAFTAILLTGGPRLYKTSQQFYPNGPNPTVPYGTLIQDVTDSGGSLNLFTDNNLQAPDVPQVGTVITFNKDLTTCSTPVPGTDPGGTPPAGAPNLYASIGTLTATGTSTDSTTSTGTGTESSTATSGQTAVAPASPWAQGSTPAIAPYTCVVTVDDGSRQCLAFFGANANPALNVSSYLQGICQTTGTASPLQTNTACPGQSIGVCTVKIQTPLTPWTYYYAPTSVSAAQSSCSGSQGTFVAP